MRRNLNMPPPFYGMEPIYDRPYIGHPKFSGGKKKYSNAALKRMEKELQEFAIQAKYRKVRNPYKVDTELNKIADKLSKKKGKITPYQIDKELDKLAQKLSKKKDLGEFETYNDYDDYELPDLDGNYEYDNPEDLEDYNEGQDGDYEYDNPEDLEDYEYDNEPRKENILEIEYEPEFDVADIEDLLEAEINGPLSDYNNDQIANQIFLLISNLSENKINKIFEKIKRRYTNPKEIDIITCLTCNITPERLVKIFKKVENDYKRLNNIVK